MGGVFGIAWRGQWGEWLWWLLFGSARPPASRRACLFPSRRRAGVVSVVRGGQRPRHDAVGSVRRTLGLQQHRDWSSALAEPYTAMVAQISISD
eukprot:scaffold295947_cov139-Cyclotella_meneghiniana.AAC.2